MIGQSKLSGDSAMNGHKTMAGAGSNSSFGVGRFPARDAGKHPDHTMGKAVMLDEGMRGAKPAVGGESRRMQAAPDHGAVRPSHFKYGSNA